MNADLQANQFLDTNILVFAYDRSAGQKYTIANQLVTECWENGNGCLSTQVLQEFYVSVTRSHLLGGLSGEYNSESRLASLEAGRSPQFVQCVRHRSWPE